MTFEITLVLHHGGKFERNENGSVEYKGGEICVWEEMETDYMNNFVLIDLCKGCRGYHKIEHVYWLVPEKGMNNGLYEVENDVDIRDMCITARRNGNEVHLYYDHPVVTNPKLICEPIIEVEEVNTDLEAENQNTENKEMLDNYESAEDGGYRPLPMADEEDSDTSFDRYHSEELRSPNSTDEEDEGSAKGVFPQFDKGARFGYVHLEIGMKFGGLKSFKNAVRDYNIFHGRQIKWVKNDKVRARAKCKEKGCTWEIYCGWSEVQKSFQIKTFYQEHSCSRVFKNNLASRKWVVEKLSEKIKIQPTLTYVEAFEYLKRDFGVHVDKAKIFKALKEAREVVEGSIRDQHGRIWDTTEYDKLALPPIKRRPGRPKKQRRKDVNEGSASNSRLKRSYTMITCTRCGIEGHNSKGCCNDVVPQRPRKWKANETPPAVPVAANSQDEIQLSQSAPSVEIETVQSQDDAIAVHDIAPSTEASQQCTQVSAPSSVQPSPQPSQVSKQGSKTRASVPGVTSINLAEYVPAVVDKEIEIVIPLNVPGTNDTNLSLCGMSPTFVSTVPATTAYRPPSVRPMTQPTTPSIVQVPFPPAPSGSWIPQPRFLNSIPTPRLPPCGPNQP